MCVVNPATFVLISFSNPARIVRVITRAQTPRVMPAIEINVRNEMNSLFPEERWDFKYRRAMNEAYDMNEPEWMSGTSTCRRTS
jgi:hypothetical protein